MQPKITLNLNSEYQFTLTAGGLAPRSQASLTVSCQDTVLMVTANFGGSLGNFERAQHCPLQVFYQEKMYAAGKIPGSFTRREGKPTHKEQLYSRIIDRSLRPFFTAIHLPYRELQLVVTLLSYDSQVSNVDVLAIYGACAALRLLGITCQVGGARVALVEGRYVINPSSTQQDSASFNLLLASSVVPGGDLAEGGTVMLEMGSKVTTTTQAEIMQAVTLGTKHIVNGLHALEDFKVKELTVPEETQLVTAQRTALQRILASYHTTLETHCREQHKLQELTKTILTQVEEELHGELHHRIQSLVRQAVRKQLLAGRKRLDARSNDDIRPIEIEMNVLPNVHGSAIFRRGLTHALGVITLGSESDAQIVESLEAPTRRSKFIFHYNFPPYCVGETGSLGFTRRREIGHGYVARKAISPSLPSAGQSTMRVVTEVLSADGSSSMASTCAASLALRHAGIPTQALVAGVAIGVVWNNEKRFIVLTDINAAEDSLSDCDLKVAGTAAGITAIQLDIHGAQSILSLAVLERTLEHSRIAINKILQHMEEAVAATPLSCKVPAKHTMPIEHSHIKFVIGKAGSNIKKIMAESQCRVDIDDEKCEVHIVGESQENIKVAVELIKECTSDFKVEIGQSFTGKIVKVFPIGCFVNLGPRKDGFITTNEFRDTATPKLGMVVQVRVVRMENNKIQLVLDK